MFVFNRKKCVDLSIHLFLMVKKHLNWLHVNQNVQILSKFITQCCCCWFNQNSGMQLLYRLHMINLSHMKSAKTVTPWSLRFGQIKNRFLEFLFRSWRFRTRFSACKEERRDQYAIFTHSVWNFRVFTNNLLSRSRDITNFIKKEYLLNPKYLT